MLDVVGLSPRAQSKRPEPAICAAPPGLSQQPWRSISSDSDDGNESDSSTVHPDDGFPGRGLSYSGPETTPDRQASRESLTPTLVAPQAASSNVRANASKSRVQQVCMYWYEMLVSWLISHSHTRWDICTVAQLNGLAAKLLENLITEVLIREPCYQGSLMSYISKVQRQMESPKKAREYA